MKRMFALILSVLLFGLSSVFLACSTSEGGGDVHEEYDRGNDSDGATSDDDPGGDDTGAADAIDGDDSGGDDTGGTDAIDGDDSGGDDTGGADAIDGDGSGGDNGSGGEVWIDVTSGLMWQNGSSVGSVLYNWEQAKSYCQNLNWGGYSDWRLPSISELRSLIRGCDATEPGGACNVTDDCREEECWTSVCHGCGYLTGPGEGGAYWPNGITGVITWYWSSSPVTNYTDYGYSIRFDLGAVDSKYIYLPDGVRCVRQ